MRSILKYVVSTGNEFEIAMPDNSIILSVQNQAGTPQMWVLADLLQSDYVMRYFKVYLTGEHIDPQLSRYLGTFQLCEGQLVCHLFEEVGKYTGVKI